jgi:actin-related protein|eukprot:COSAG01_NODE_3089_length_6601_cov_9.640572_3_plen_104_part_00
MLLAGYGNSRFGLSGEEQPSSLRNIVWNSQSQQYVPMIQRKKMESMACDWDSIEKLWERILEDELVVESSSSFISSTISPFGPKSYPEDMAELLFETFDVAGL